MDLVCVKKKREDCQMCMLYKMNNDDKIRCIVKLVGKLHDRIRSSALFIDLKMFP